jgi:hypothetical protein
LRYLWGIPILLLTFSNFIYAKTAFSIQHTLQNQTNNNDPLLGLISAVAGLVTAIVLFLRERKKP